MDLAADRAGRQNLIRIKMGYVMPMLEAALNDWATVISILIFVFNFSFRRENLDLVISCLVVMGLYIAGVFLLEYINSFPSDTSHNYRYSLRLCLHAVGLLSLISLTKFYEIGIYTKVVAACFCYNALMQLMLHIDRNIIGLNKIDVYFKEGVVLYNGTFDGGYWWLWDWYTESLNVVAWLMMLFLLVGNKIIRR